MQGNGPFRNSLTVSGDTLNTWETAIWVCVGVRGSGGSPKVGKRKKKVGSVEPGGGKVIGGPVVALIGSLTCCVILGKSLSLTGRQICVCACKCEG